MSAETKAGQRPAKAGRTGRVGLWLAVGGILGILLLVALGWFVLRDQPGAAVQGAEAVPPRGSGPPAPDFTVPTLNGGRSRSPSNKASR